MNDPKKHSRENAKLLVEPILPVVGRVLEKAMQGVIEQACEMQLRIAELERENAELREKLAKEEKT